MINNREKRGQRKEYKEMNRIDKALVNAKVRADVAKDAFCERFLTKKNGDSDIISKVIFMVIVIALVIVIKWGVSYILTGSTSVTENSANSKAAGGVMKTLSDKFNNIFNESN